MATEKILTRDFILSFFAQFAFSSVFCILFCPIRLLFGFLYSHPYVSDLSFGQRISRGRDWSSHRSLERLLFNPEAFCWKSPFKNSRKEIHDHRCYLVCLLLLCLSLCDAFLASFYCPHFAWDRLGFLLNCLFHIDRQHQPRSPPRTESKLLLSGYQFCFCSCPLLWDASHQPIQFQHPLSGLYRLIPMLPIHHHSVESMVNPSIREPDDKETTSFKS